MWEPTIEESPKTLRCGFTEALLRTFSFVFLAFLMKVHRWTRGVTFGQCRMPHCLTPDGRITYRGRAVIYEPIVLQELLQELPHKYPAMKPGTIRVLIAFHGTQSQFPKCRISAKTGTHLQTSDTAHARPWESLVLSAHWTARRRPILAICIFLKTFGLEYRRTRPIGVRISGRGDDRTREAAGTKSRKTITSLWHFRSKHPVAIEVLTCWVALPEQLPREGSLARAKYQL